VQGLFQWPRDNDWYRLEVPFTGKNLVRIDLSGVSGVDSTLALYDADGELLKSIDVARKGGAEALVDIGVSQGTYYLVAKSRWGWHPSDSYRLQARRTGSWSEDQELEPNDTLEQSNTISVGKPITGTFQGTRDNDWYRLRVPDAGTHVLEIKLTGVPGVDSEIVLYDADGKALARANGGAKADPETLVHVGITEGTYYVVPCGRDVGDPSRDPGFYYTVLADVRPLLKVDLTFRVAKKLTHL
jgi:hypothetical protein